MSTTPEARGDTPPAAAPQAGATAPGAKGWTGSRLTRFEDERLVRGAGEFIADADEPGMLQAVILRSPVASGRITRLDVSPALTVPGVVAVLTAEDAASDGLGGIPWEVCPPGFERIAAYQGDPAVADPQPLLALDRVRYVGEPVALVLGETMSAALDGAEQILLELEDEEPLVDLGSAPVRESAVFTYETGDRTAVERAFAAADLAVTLQTHIPRLAPAPLETRGYLSRFNGETGRWTLVAAAGKPHPIRDTIAQHVLHVDPQTIRVIAPEVGGGFGAKNIAYVECALVLWASKRVGRPVRWISGRNESFLSDTQGRDHLISAKLAVNASGRLLAVDYDSIVNLGAYLGPRAVVPCLSGLKVLTGPYRIGAANARVRAVLTNTVPTCPYRGAGVPETAFVVERMVDMAARRLGLDPIEIRRRNLVGPDQLPWTSPTGATMHSVDYPAVFEAAVARFGQPGGVEAHPHAEGPRRGMGVAFTIEGYGTTFDEAAEFCVDSDGGIEVRIGTKSSGQSHETSYAQIAADALDVDPASIVIVQGDTDRIRRGHGTGASRSITTGGSAILRSAATLLNEARADASTLLQCAPDRLVYRAGCFEVSGTQPRASVDLATLARSRPDRRIHVTDSFRPDCFTFPGGCHVAEVEVDVETGAVEILRYVAVHDAGVAVNPTVVEGQLHGGIAQGIGAALMEAVRYDEVGEAVTATFLDYALPRADNLPRFEIILSGTPCASNLLGAKPVGEAGTVAAPPAILNAIVDALRGFGVEHIDLPATPERVREALERARRSRQQAQTQDRTLP